MFRRILFFLFLSLSPCFAATPTITSGAGLPTSIQPSGSLYLRSDGTPSTSLYISAGSGTWNPSAAGTITQPLPSLSVTGASTLSGGGTQSGAWGLGSSTFTGTGASINWGTGAASLNGAVSVMTPPYNAKCDGSTDDTSAINSALSSGAELVTIPAGKTCYSATGVTVPPGVTLSGLSFSPNNPPSGSEILCGASATNCVTLGNGTLAPMTLANLIVASNATGTPTADGVYVDNGYNVNIRHVMVYNAYDGYYWKSNGTGLGGHMDDDYAGKIADAYIVQDTWPELRINQSRFGMNGSGDLAANAFIRVTGGIGGTSAGPNGLVVVNSQFNQGSTAVGTWLQFTNCGGTCIGGANPVDATEFIFVGDHVENLSNAFITSDSTWNVLNDVFLADNRFSDPSVPFWQLNASTSLSENTFTGGSIAASTFSLAPNTQINHVAISGVAIDANVSITSCLTCTNSQFDWTGNSVSGNISFAGPWLSLAVVGGDETGGTFSSTATGCVLLQAPFATDTQGGITAAGTTQGTATILTASYSSVTTTPPGTGVLLPTECPNHTDIVWNNGANALMVYPPSGQSFYGLATNVPETDAAGASLKVIYFGGDTWLLQ